MSEAALEKVQLERDGLAKELQLVQSAIPKDKVRTHTAIRHWCILLRLFGR